jgi:hypothetical protein
VVNLDKAAMNDDLADKLWEKSEVMVGLKQEENHF